MTLITLRMNSTPSQKCNRQFLTWVSFYSRLHLSTFKFKWLHSILFSKYKHVLVKKLSQATLFVIIQKVTCSGINLFFIIILSGVRLSPLGIAANIGLLYQPQMIDGGDCGAIRGMKIGRGNRNSWRKSAPVPLCPPQIPTWPDPGLNPSCCSVKRATAWGMAWPGINLTPSSDLFNRMCKDELRHVIE
jgi:hypothetical protein